MRPALLIAANDLRRRLRDRSFYIYALVTPLLLSWIVTLAFSGPGGFDTTIGLVDLDRSGLSTRIVEGLMAGDDEGLAFDAAVDAAEARTRLEDEEIDAAIVFPVGFEASTSGGQPISLTVLRSSSDEISSDVATAVAEGVAARVATARLALTTLGAASGAPPAPAAVAGAADLEPVLALDLAQSLDEFEGASYFAPAMGIFFLFFTVAAGARSVLSEQREGTLVRVRAAPVSDAAIVGGKTIAVVVIGLAAFVVLYIASAALFGADWGAPAPVLAVIAATVLAVAGIGSLITGVARTERQAEGLATIVTFVFALAGGNFVGPGDVPDGLRALTRSTPNGWALEAFTELSAGRGGFGDVALAVAVLLIIAAVTGAIGLAGIHRKLSL